MRLFFKAKDGGRESTVTGYWLIEAKRLLSIVLLCFDGRSREAFHTHAFDAVSWVIRGGLTETLLSGEVVRYRPSFRPIFTPRKRFHRVDSDAGKTWVLSFRGPWVARWQEWRPLERRRVTLTHGRHEVA